MKCSYAVSFEFLTKHPITVRGEIEATSVRTIAARALDEATIKEPNLKWSSVVILLNRLESEQTSESEDGTLLNSSPVNSSPVKCE